MTLTQIERASLPYEFNLADGHANHGWIGRQAAIIDSLPELFRESHLASYEALRQGFFDSFFSMARQHSWGSARARTAEFFSASQAIEAAAHVARSTSRECFITEPNFDNIPDSFRRVGVKVVALPEECLKSANISVYLESLRGRALFVTLPGNPSGFSMSRDEFANFVRCCSDFDIFLFLDFSFRFYSDSLLTFDQYQILEASGCSFVSIEDTGKTWATRDLKVGMTVASADCSEYVSAVRDDFLLNIPPLSLALLKRFIEYSIEIGGEDFLSAVRRNRQALRETLAATEFSVFNTASTISVELIALPANRRGFVQELANAGIRVLPGRYFFWSEHDRGSDYMRVALAREPEMVKRALQEVSKLLATPVAC